MDAKEFKAGFEAISKWGEAERMVNKLDKAQQLVLLNALEIVDRWVGLDMRSEFYMGILRAKTRKVD